MVQCSADLDGKMSGLVQSAGSVDGCSPMRPRVALRVRIIAFVSTL